MSLIEESRRRIVTTNVGSLPRRHSLSDCCWRGWTSNRTIPPRWRGKQPRRLPK